MAVKANTARGVSSLLNKGENGLYASGNGLYLKISGKGTGSWIYRYQLDGKRRKMGLGSCADISLADARDTVAKHGALLARGIDPSAQKEQQAIEKKKLSVTMADIAHDYIAGQSKSWSANTVKAWTTANRLYIEPALGHLAPAEVTTDQVLALLQPIWLEVPTQAKKLRSRIETLLDAAKALKLRDGENVAAWRGHLALLLPKQSTTNQRNHPALPWDQVRTFWQAMKKESGASVDVLQLIMLTAVRTKEAAPAHWSEFDLDAGVWTIPAERMKMGKPQRVPLSTAVLELLETLPRYPSGYLFESNRSGKSGAPVAARAPLGAIARSHQRKHKLDGTGWLDEHGEKITAHGFRSTFRDWATDNTNTPDRVIERCLAHSSASQTVKAYLRTDELERRRELMEAWGEYVTRPAASNVVQLSRKA